MNKFLKLLAPVILSIYFIGLFAGPGWAKEGDLTAKVEMPDIVNRGETFTAKVTMFKEDSSGNKAPIIGAGNVTIEESSDFIIKSIEPGDSGSNGEWYVNVKAPKTDGKYQMNVVCLPSTNEPNSAIKSSNNIKVMLKSSIFTISGFLVGAYYGTEGGLSIRNGDGKRLIDAGSSMDFFGGFLSWTAGLILGGLGLDIGCVIGSYSGNIIDDLVTHNEYATNILYPINYPLRGVLDWYQKE